MKLKAVLAMGILMAVCVLAMPADESDAGSFKYIASFADYEGGTSELFLTDENGILNPIGEGGTPWIEISDLEHEGLVFKGWKDVSGSYQWIDPGATEVKLIGDADFVAQWALPEQTNSDSAFYSILGIVILTIGTLIAIIAIAYLCRDRE